MATDEIALADIEIGSDTRILRVADGNEVHADIAGKIVSEVRSFV
ncbi:hypothetical protein [Mesorhizobium sp. M1E.F.Ca.ET.041.01.1.1]|nr:hypothetical protein [Mesorhizobium sp. M1E.F.Ca.ET.041.01.1.1]